MTQKEALAETTRQLGNARDTLKTSKNKAVLTATANKIDYLVAVQAALRGPTREMDDEFGKYKKFKEYFDDLYGKGLEVENWHMNGETIPFDDFYESACEYAEL